MSKSVPYMACNITMQLNVFGDICFRVVITIGTFKSNTWNFYVKSSCIKPRLNLVMISRNFRSNDNFFFGQFLLFGVKSSDPYNSDDSIMLILSW